MLFRLVLLLAIAGGLILFALSNWSPLLALTFLGMQTPAMPLALWILGAIAAGGVTSLMIRTLFSLSNYAAVRAARAQFRQEARRQTGFQPGATSTPRPEPSRPTSSKPPSTPEEDDSDWQDWEGYEESGARQQPDKKPAAAAEPADDWEKGVEDDWDWVDEEAPSQQAARRSPPQPVTQERKDYEAKQQPKTVSRSGSVYSYGYREPGKSGVGKPEKVVDAEYRVIVPPYSTSTPPAAPSEAEADDWFEEGSDEFEDDRPRRSR